MGKIWKYYCVYSFYMLFEWIIKGQYFLMFFERDLGKSNEFLDFSLNNKENRLVFQDSAERQQIKLIFSSKD